MIDYIKRKERIIYVIIHMVKSNYPNLFGLLQKLEIKLLTVSNCRKKNTYPEDNVY